MFCYSITKCLKLMSLGGLHPLKQHPQADSVLFGIWSFALWSIIVLDILKIYHKEAPVFTDYINTFSEMSMIIHAIIRISSLYSNRQGLASLLTQMQDRFWDHNGPAVPPEEKLYQEAFHARTKHTFFAFLLFCAINTSSMSLLTLFVGEDVLPYECYRPAWLPFYALWFYQISGVNVALLISIICFDTLLMNFISSTYLQFRMLNREVEAMGVGGDGLGVKERIRLVVEHHHFLMKYTQLINDCFSSCLLAYMIMIVTSMCVEMYNISSSTDVGAIIKSAVYINVALSGFVIFFCIPAQHLSDEAEKVSTSAFSSGWCDRPQEFGTAVLMMMANGRPVKISAGSFVDINLETSLSTIKTMVSYCTFLRTMSIDD